MKSKYAIPAAYFILVGMLLVYMSSLFITLWFRNPIILVVAEALQSLLAIMLFAIGAYSMGFHNVSKTLSSMRRLFLFSLLLFVSGGFAGYLLYDDAMAFVSPILDEMKVRFNEVKDISPHIFPIIYFGNNTRAASITGLLIGSVPLLGFIYAMSMLMINGAVVGFVSHLPGFSPQTILLSIIPHGIFEIPAFLMAGSVGMRLNISFLRILFLYFSKGSREKIEEEKNRALDAARLFTIIIPLLFVAALVESYLTPLLIKIMGLRP